MGKPGRSPGKFFLIVSFVFENLNLGFVREAANIFLCFLILVCFEESMMLLNGNIFGFTALSNNLKINAKGT